MADAIDADAFSFYRKYDFQPIRKTENRLVMKMSTALKAFGAS
ncbi:MULTISPECIES: hypothetical protein [Rhodococcus]|nr:MULTISPECIES: hypothetical protein [Rhodococcus]